MRDAAVVTLCDVDESILARAGVLVVTSISLKLN